MRLRISNFVLISIMAIAIGIATVYLSQAQTGGLRRENGTIFAKGEFVEFNCGGTINANDAVFLDTNGNVEQAATLGQTTTLIGVAFQACSASGSATKTQVQITGIATVVADSTVNINDRVGAPTTTGGRVKTITSTLAVAAGSTAVTSSAANGSIVTGHDAGGMVLGRALTAATAGNTLTILLGQG